MTGPASGEPLVAFLADMRRLRAECSWKREQTHRSLARYLLEETHETLEAIDSGDLDPKVIAEMPTFTLHSTAVEWKASQGPLLSMPAAPPSICD